MKTILPFMLAAVAMPLVVSIGSVRLEAAERQTHVPGAGTAGGRKHNPVSIGGAALVKSITVISGDRINRIELHGTDGSVASFGGKKPAPNKKAIELAEGEYVVGFQGEYSTGGGPFRAGWFNVRVIIGGSDGHRMSERFGTGGYSAGVNFNGAELQSQKSFSIRAPAGYEVVGLTGNTGDVIDFAALIIQKR